MTTIVYQRSFFADLNGLPLDGGSVYIGTANQDPQTNPISVYWDSALSVPAVQPLTVTAGYVVNNGIRAAVYASQSSYSLRVRNRAGVEVDYVAATDGVALASVLSISSGSSLVGFLQSGTGAVASTVQGELRAHVRPEQFGAVGDGSTDDTAALNKAIATGHNVHLGEKNYKITAALSALSAGQGLIGEGRGLTTITVSGSGYDVVSLATDNSFVEGVYFNSTSQRSSGKTIKLPNATRGNAVRNSKFQNQFTAISIDAAAVITYLEDLEILDTTATTGVSIHIGGGNDTFLTRIVTDTSGTEPLAGLRIVASQAIWATDCDFIDSGTGLLIDPSSGLITWLFFDNCAFDTGAVSGMNVGPSGTATVKGLFFNGCWFATNTERGAIIQRSGSATLDGVFFDQCKFVNNGQAGLLVVAGVTNVHISDPVVSGNSLSSSGTYSGIDIQANVTDFSVKGGRIGQMFGFSNTQAYGILINAGTSDNYTIRGVDVRGNATAGIFDGGSGTSKHISENLGYVTRNKGAGTVAIGASSVAVTHGLAGTPSAGGINITDTSSRAVSGINSVWISAIGATTFTVNTNANVAGANFTFEWNAKVAGA